MNNMVMKKYTPLFMVITVLVAILIFFIIQKSSHDIFTTAIATPTPYVVSVTPISPNAVATLSLKQEQQNTVTVHIDSQNKPVTAVQLALSYNPQVLSSVTINPGQFFTNPVVLSNTVDPHKKMIFYVLAIRPNQQPPTGIGDLATITYTVNFGVASTISLEFLPQTKITELGIEESILKRAIGIEIPI